MLVTGATGRVGRVVVDLLIDAGVPVRALTHRSEAAATLPANVTGAISIGAALAPFAWPSCAPRAVTMSFRAIAGLSY